MKGIYGLEINNKFYIGKDTQIHKQKRKKEHFNLLKKGNHYNNKLQDAVNEYGIDNLVYHCIITYEDCTPEELEKYEIHYIELYKSYEDGYNLTKGGIGMTGFITAPETLELRSFNTLGEKNIVAKLTELDAEKLIVDIIEGKTNDDLALKYNLHSRYVSLIRHKKRWMHIWERYKNYIPVKSSGNDKNKKVTPDVFKDIVQRIENKETNASIEIVYDLSAGTVSRIKNKKLYKNYWDEYFPNK